LKTDFGGLPIAFHLTGGEASDSRNFETLLDIGPDLNPRAALGDKGYDSKSNRDAARQRGICPAIPYRSNTKDMPTFFPKTLYKARARIEQAVGKLKRFKRIALRCEKTAQNYGSFVALALGLILIKSVHHDLVARMSAAKYCGTLALLYAASRFHFVHRAPKEGRRGTPIDALCSTLRTPRLHPPEFPWRLRRGEARVLRRQVYASRHTRSTRRLACRRSTPQRFGAKQRAPLSTQHALPGTRFCRRLAASLACQSAESLADRVMVPAGVSPEPPERIG
jgi:transposase